MKILIGPYPRYNKKTQTTPERKVQIRIDKYDTWSMDHTLAMIIHPMLIQLKATQHGAPYTDDEDVPEALRSTSAEKPDPNDVDTMHFARWDWILTEIIWAFEQHISDDAEDQFYSGETDHLWIPVDKEGKHLSPAAKDSKKKPPKGTMGYQFVQGPNHTFKCDLEGLKAFEERKKNGFRLFGKYYQNLWD